MAYGEDSGVYLCGSTFDCARRSSRSSPMADSGDVTAMTTFAESKRRIVHVTGLADRVAACLNRRLASKVDDDATLSSLTSKSTVVDDRSAIALLAVVERLESRWKFFGVRQSDVPEPSPVPSQVPFSIQYDQDLSHLDYRIWNQIPVFDGTSPFGWIARAEHFFRICQIVDEEKLDWISLCFEGDALFWYMRELASRDFMNWGEFKRRLLARFAPVKRSSRQAVQLKKERISHVVEMPKAIPAEDSIQEEQSQESSDSQMAIKVADEENSITEPQVPLYDLESDHSNKILGDFGENYVSEGWSPILDDLPLELAGSGEQSKGVPPIFDDFQTEAPVNFYQSTSFRTSPCVHQMLDVLPLKYETMHVKLEKYKLSKSWKFNFKLRPSRAVLHIEHFLSRDSATEDLVSTVSGPFLVHSSLGYGYDAEFVHRKEQVHVFPANVVDKWSQISRGVHEKMKVESENLQGGSWSCSMETRDHLYSHSSLILDELSSDFGSDVLVAPQKEQTYVLLMEVYALPELSISGQDRRQIASLVFDIISHKIEQITAMNKQRKGFKYWRFIFKQLKHSQVMPLHVHKLNASKRNLLYSYKFPSDTMGTLQKKRFSRCRQMMEQADKSWMLFRTMLQWGSGRLRLFFSDNRKFTFLCDVDSGEAADIPLEDERSSFRKKRTRTGCKARHFNYKHAVLLSCTNLPRTMEFFTKWKTFLLQLLDLFQEAEVQLLKLRLFTIKRYASLAAGIQHGKGLRMEASVFRKDELQLVRTELTAATKLMSVIPQHKAGELQSNLGFMSRSFLLQIHYRLKKQKFLKAWHFKYKLQRIENTIMAVTQDYMLTTQHKLVAALITGKRAVKVKVLEAAEASKRIADQQENDCTMKQTAMKLEQARPGQENLRKQGLEKDQMQKVIGLMATLFAVWHRWKIRDCVHCAYCIMEHWFHLQSSQVGAFWRSYSLVNMSQVLVPQFLSFQLEDKLHLKGRGIDMFQKLRGTGLRRRKQGIHQEKDSAQEESVNTDG